MWRPVALHVLAICAMALLISTSQILDECAISLDGDMPRHLMNGVFLRDLVADGELLNVREYTFRYFAKYPALSIGLHPPLLPAAEAGTFAVAGISVLAGRLTVVAFLLAGALAWYAAVRRVSDDLVALLSTLILVTSPIVAGYSRLVMTEIPTLSLVMISAWLLQRYCDAPGPRRAALFGAAFVAALYAKQLAVLVAPVLALYAIWRRGLGVLIRREVLVVACLGVLATLPLAFITWEMSRVNVDVVRDSVQNASARPSPVQHVRSVLAGQLSVPAMVLLAGGLGVAIWRRSGLALAAWIAIVYVELWYLTGGLQPARYGIYLVPALCFYAAYVVRAGRGPVRAVLVTLVVGVIAYQTTQALTHPLPSACGYEQVARYIVENGRGATVLFSGSLDTGYFVFFVRKHDSERHTVVLRADKLLTTSRMHQLSVEEHISRPEQLYDLLRALGTRYIVLEDVHMESPALEMLHREVKSDRFVQRLRIPAGRGDRRLAALSLGVYEFREAGPASADARIRMTMPLAGESLDLPLEAVRNGPGVAR